MRTWRSGLYRKRGGFTIVEMLIYMVIAAVVATAIYKLLLTQNRAYLKQRELQDVRGTLRSAANLLAAELRQASAADGDVYSIDPTGFSVRSILGTGIVCGEHNAQPRFGLWGTSGYFNDTEADSALVYAKGSEFLEDDQWLVVNVEQVWPAGGGGVPDCDWDITYDTEVVVQIDSAGNPLAGLETGAPFRAFRRVEYSLIERDGRWWLGSRVGAASDFEILTGPLGSGDGLQLEFYDSTGVATTDPTQVRFADIKLRGESQGKVHRGGGQGSDVQVDTLSMRVSLRG